MPREGSCSAGPEGGAVAGECPNPRLQVDCEKHDDLCTRFGVTGDGEPMLCSILADCTHFAPRPSELVSTDFDPHAPLVLAEDDATGTPQLLWFRNGTFVGAYEGAHDAKAIKAWVAVQ